MTDPPLPVPQQTPLSPGRRARAASEARRRLTDAVAALYGKALDKALLSPQRVQSADEGRARLAESEAAEGMADDVQRVVVLAVPVLRTVLRGARITKVPWALVVSTAFSVGTTVRAGVKEVQVLGSLLAHRIERATGRPADRDLVKKLTIELYLKPKRAPELTERRLRAHRLARRWVFRGAFGRTTARGASRALDTAEQLDVNALVDQWDALLAALRDDA